MSNKVAETHDEIYEENQESKADNRQVRFNCYRLVTKDDPNFKINGRQARKGGAKAEWLGPTLGWAFEKKEDAEAIAAEYTKGIRTIRVVSWYDEFVEDKWGNDTNRSKLAKRNLKHRIEKQKNNEKLQRIESECDRSGLHPSWLCLESLPEDREFTDQERKAFELCKPKWDGAQHEQKIVELKEHDLQCEENALNEEPVPDFVHEFNKKHAVVLQGKVVVLKEGKDEHGKLKLSFCPPSNMVHLYRSDKDKDGKILFNRWMNHPQRRTFPDGIIFDPRTCGHYGGFYNTFRGFSIEPQQGDCSKYWELLEILCGGEQEKVNYVRRWFAHLIQRPWELAETALALRGEEGIGKGRLIGYLSKLVSPHCMEQSSTDRLTGRFNSQLRDTLLVYVSEAHWTGGKTEAGVLKALITDPQMAIEQKGVDLVTATNYNRVVLSSNEDAIAPLGITDRRFFIINCDSSLRENHDFFKALEEQMLHKGGLEALMYDLLNEDLSGWHPRQMPRNSDGFDLKLRDMAALQRWLFERLREGSVGDTRSPVDSRHPWNPNAETVISKDEVYNDYKLYCIQAEKKHYDSGKFWKEMRKYLGEIEVTRPGSGSDRKRVVCLPSLQDARQSFEKYAKEGLEIWED